jgi:choline dehydrogenase-like flavoprotein
MLAGFLAAEDDLDHGGDGLHGRGGPIPLNRHARLEDAPFDRAVRTAMVELGYPVCDDYHAPGATGVSRWALTIRDGRRVSTNDAYLEPARDRPNLAVRGGVLVDRIVLDGRRAVGVLSAAGEQIEAREVVVSAGAIHSPAVLLRSGVGVGDGLPVGANLREHAATPGFEVALRREGRLEVAGGPAMCSLLRHTSGLVEEGPNDLQVIWFNSTDATEAGLARGRLIGAVMRVHSQGEVRLRSDDPQDDPVVDFRMLADERDLGRLRDVVRRTLAVVRHSAVASIADGVMAGRTSIDELDSDAQIDAWLLAGVGDYVHAAGSCRMGQAGDPAAVVDTDLRVLGYEGLRVCDASVMPDVPKANTHLTTVAIAELLAARIRAGR